MKVLLIGFGGIGKRHYESLMNNRYIKVFIHDINTDLELPSKYKEQTVIIDEDTLLKEKSFDLLILATNANVRAEILDKLLSKIKFGKVIIEKPVAQSIKELKALKVLDQNIPIYVNFPQRYYPLYLDLKKMDITNNFKIDINGNDWGMACNLWHFVDLIEYITSAKLKEIFWSDIKWVPSKRPGFEEILGECNIEFSNNNKLSLIQSDNKVIPGCSIRINGSNDLNIDIEDYYFKSSSNKRFKTGDKVDLYQSELTLNYLDNENFILPRISHIYNSTLVILKSIMMIKYNKITENIKLPIS